MLVRGAKERAKGSRDGTMRAVHQPEAAGKGTDDSEKPKKIRS